MKVRVKRVEGNKINKGWLLSENDLIKLLNYEIIEIDKNTADQIWGIIVVADEKEEVKEYKRKDK